MTNPEQPQERGEKCEEYCLVSKKDGVMTCEKCGYKFGEESPPKKKEPIQGKCCDKVVYNGEDAPWFDHDPACLNSQPPTKDWEERFRERFGGFYIHADSSELYYVKTDEDGHKVDEVDFRGVETVGSDDIKAFIKQELERRDEMWKEVEIVNKEIADKIAKGSRKRTISQAVEIVEGMMAYEEIPPDESNPFIISYENALKEVVAKLKELDNE